MKYPAGYGIIYTTKTNKQTNKGEKKMIKVKFIEYLKDAATYHPMRETTFEVDEKTFYDFVECFGYRKTAQGHFQKRIAFDRYDEFRIM